MLNYFNDEFSSSNWFRDLMDEKITHTLKRPLSWPEREKLVEVMCFCLLDNHFHLLLKEIKEGGISKFMKKIGIGMSKNFNEKYKEKGSLFQGAYHSKTVSEDDYLKYVSVYIQVKNCFEMYNGHEKTGLSFDELYDWSTKYPYCSLGNYSGTINSPIIDKGLLGEIFTPKDYKIFSRDFIESKANLYDEDMADFWSSIHFE
jgi:putative transposase